MSKVVEIATQRVSVPLHTPFVTALRRTETTDTVLVRVTDSDGVTGWGEAPQVWQVTGESLAGAEACIAGPLAAAVEGTDADDLAATCRAVAGAVAGNHGAKGAVDVALPDRAARATDAARVAAVRDAVGPEVGIRLDANQGWTPRDAVRVISTLEDLGLEVELVEQPVAAADLEGLAWVTARVGTPVMADESVYGLRDLVEVIRRRAADLVNVKLAKCGGLTTGRTLLELARAHGMGTAIGSMMETHVGLGAAASLAAACGTTVVADLDAAWWSRESPYVGGMTYDGATVVLPDAPGLGIGGLA